MEKQTTINKLFETNVINTWAEQGKSWLEELPDIISYLSEHWSLTDIYPVPNLSYNYVALAIKDNHIPVVIKISCDKKLILDEYKTLMHFNGCSSINALDISEAYNALLLEQAVPGDSLKTTTKFSPVEKIIPYCTVVKSLSEKSPPKDSDYEHISDWLKIIDKTNSKKIPSYLIATAVKVKNNLLNTVPQETLLHGDLHLDNILLNKDKWMAIDPKGIIGELSFEPFLFDFLSKEEKINIKNTPGSIKNIANIFAENLTISAQRLLQWTFVRALLSACWFVEDNGDPTKAVDMAKSIYPLIEELENTVMETSRLILQAPSSNDLNDLIALRTTPEVMRYAGNGHVQTVEKIKETLETNIAYYKKHHIGFLSVLEKTSGKFVGQAGLFHLGFDESQGDIELAYRLLPKYWGKGYATELAKALIDYGFSHLTLDKLVAATHPENIASQQVLSKSGFISVGEVPWYNMSGVIGFEVYRIIAWAKAAIGNHNEDIHSAEKIVVKTPWSIVIRLSTKQGYLYLKQTPPALFIEADIINVLRDECHIENIPKLVDSNKSLHCFLMKDSGRPLREILKQQFDVTLLCKAVNQFTLIQLSTADHINRFLDIGVPDWRLDKFPRLFEHLLSQKEILITDGLSEVEISELESLLPKITSLCEKLSSYSIKQTIVQCDFHDNNILIADKSNELTFIDLGEIVISHPFFSVITCLRQTKKHHALIDQDDRYIQLKDTCLKNYINFESREDLLDAFEIAKLLWIVYEALAQYRLRISCDSENFMSFQRHGKLSDSLKEFVAVCGAYDETI